MIWAFDVAQTRPGFAARFHRAALDHGVFIRPVGQTVYVMPPYVTAIEDMHLLAEALRACLDHPDI